MSEFIGEIEYLDEWRAHKSPADRGSRNHGLDQIAMTCMVIDLDGGIRWGNSAADRLIVQGGRGSGFLLDLVHPRERTGVALAIAEVQLRGKAELLVRLRDTEADAAGHYMQLLFTRASTDGDASGRERSSKRLLIQGWDVTDLVSRIHELEVHAFRDPLTGLANRLTFNEMLDYEMARTRRSGPSVAVLFADVDGLKRVNDTAGHAAGDQVLIAMSERLRGVLRPGDTLARVGGDEFALICPDITDQSQALVIADRLRSAAMVPALVAGRVMTVHLSVGVSIAADDDPGDTAEAILRRADQAMYEAKRATGVLNRR